MSMFIFVIMGCFKGKEDKILLALIYKNIQSISHGHFIKTG